MTAAAMIAAETVPIAGDEPCVPAAALVPPHPDRLQAVIATFCELTGMPVTAFGRVAMGDPRFVLDLRLGRSPRAEALLRVAAFIRLWGERRWHEQPRIGGAHKRRATGHRHRWRLRREGDLFILASTVRA